MRLVRQLRRELGTSQTTIKRVADQLGCGVKSVRSWVKQFNVDSGESVGTTTEDRAGIKTLEQENRELRRANEILGGAYQDGDGVFRFKADFSRLRAEFNTYERIHAAEPYESLTTDWRSHGGQAAGSEHFFPLYRAAITSATDGTVAHRAV